jgi:His-Xaa-Ser system radical SAM maturase HxsC
MIPLRLPALSDAEAPFVTRLRGKAAAGGNGSESYLLDTDERGATYAGPHGVIAIDGATPASLEGDIILVDPRAKRIERILRAGSPHNTLLVTEQCDQLCVMCSQPPKKTHVDRFDWLEDACLLAEPDLLIGISGGEPTLYKDRLLTLIERVLTNRPDLQFHILTNGQHFEQGDIERLRRPAFRRVSWGIPLYAAAPDLHDEIVGKSGAFARLETSFAHLLMGGARVELRTVLVSSNLEILPALARYVTTRLRFIEAWSIMQLEHIGFARGRWDKLFVDHRSRFEPIAQALDWTTLHGVRSQLFNFPRCTVPAAYRGFAIASISDWKRKYSPACSACHEQSQCSGFFEWHPDEQAMAVVEPL